MMTYDHNMFKAPACKLEHLHILMCDFIQACRVLTESAPRLNGWDATDIGLLSVYAFEVLVYLLQRYGGGG